jgi:hypothetical protein
MVRAWENLWSAVAFARIQHITGFWTLANFLLYQTARFMLTCKGAGLQTGTSASLLIYQVKQTSLPFHMPMAQQFILNIMQLTTSYHWSIAGAFHKLVWCGGVKPVGLGKTVRLMQGLEAVTGTVDR